MLHFGTYEVGVGEINPPGLYYRATLGCSVDLLDY